MKKGLIHNRIRELRFNAGELTQQQLADALDVTRQTIIALEKGKYYPSLQLAFQIAATFKLPLEEVFQSELAQETKKSLQTKSSEKRSR
ncbi:MAG: transcriptional regulator [Spirochaetaceae bacterium]|nr:transcriptional regulator [Spirochaetaceae bacterium]